MNLLNVNVADLAKVDKLLDRIENEMKKKRTENFYTSPEKYVNYMNKTAELYSLISEEVISFLDIIGLTDFITTFQKLFRGLQQQVHSMLKFTLYYYNARSLQVREAMIRGKMPVEGSGDSNVKPPVTFAVKIQKTNLSGQPIQVQTARDRTFPSLGVPNHPYITGSVVSPSIPDSAKGLYMYSPSTARSAQESNYLSAEHDEAYEVEGYQVEYSQIKQEIDELLEAKDNILKIQPTTLALNLKQVLRSLENTKRNTKVIIDESDDEELEDEIDLENMIKKLMKACTDAQKKTFQKIIDYFRTTKNEGQVLFRKDQSTMPDQKILDIDKKIMKREFEAVVQLKQQEISFLKKRVEAIEQDRDIAEEKYSKLQIEHSSCEQEKRDTALHIASLEAEIAGLREAFHEGRKTRLSQIPQSPGLPGVDSPSLKPSQSMQASQEVSRRMMEQMSQYRAEIEALKSDLRDERKARMLHLNTMESNTVSGVQSPAKSPMRMSQFEAKPSSSSMIKSTAKDKFSFDEKATKGDGRGSSIEKRSDSISLSRKGSMAKQENNSNGMPHTPKDGRKPNMPHGESEFKRMKNAPSLYVDYDPKNLDNYQQGDTENKINSNEGQSGGLRDQQGSQRSLMKIEHKDSSFKGEVGSQPSVKKDASLRGLDSNKNSPPSTLTKIGGGANDRAQTEDKNSKAKATSRTERASPTKGTASKNNDKRRTSISQDHAQVIKPTAIDANENNEPASITNLGTATTTKTSAANANAQKGKKNMGSSSSKKPKGSSQESKAGGKPEDEYLIKDGAKSSQREKKEASISMEKREPPSSTKRNAAREDRPRERSVCVDKAVQTDDLLGPVSFRDNKRNLSLSKEVYNKPYNLISPIQKEMRSTSGFESGLNAIHSQNELKNARDSSESRLASLVGKPDSKPRVGKSLIPNFDEKFKHPLSVLEDKSINEDSARNSKTRFPTDVENSAERIYSDVEIYPRSHGKGKNTNFKKTDRTEKEMLLNHQMRSASSNSPLKHREDMGPQEGDDAQMNAMYKAMMARAEQDPKILSIMKNYARDKGESIDEESEFTPDYNLFVDYINNLRIAHQRCGENCSHLQRFYARIGFYHIWNHRSPLAMGKPDIVEEYSKKSKLPSRLPNIPEKKVLKMAS